MLPWLMFRLGNGASHITSARLQILRGTHFKAIVQGHLRPLHTEECPEIGHQGQGRGHQRPWPRWPWANSSPAHNQFSIPYLLK